ncbi:MAG: DUF6292 family protein [Actinomycetota bacterium]|nr:DUF6292 family protein [Actinomycetota bacterium]
MTISAMFPQLPISARRPRKRPAVLAQRRQDSLLRPNHYIIHYLTAYLGAVIGGLSQRGIVIHAVELAPTPKLLSCSITLNPPRQPAGLSGPVWVAYQASWDEHRGWSCQLHHIAKDQSRIRYLGEPLVPAPDVVADFIAGLNRVQTLESLGPPRPAARPRHTPQELADDLIRFTPTCTWIG